MSRLDAMHAARITPDEWEYFSYIEHHILILSHTYAAIYQTKDRDWILFCGTQDLVWPKRTYSKLIEKTSLAIAKAKAKKIAETFNAKVANEQAIEEYKPVDIFEWKEEKREGAITYVKAGHLDLEVEEYGAGINADCGVAPRLLVRIQYELDNRKTFAVDNNYYCKGMEAVKYIAIGLNVKIERMLDAKRYAVSAIYSR